jgi:uncharacterized protein YndB with AHSA1/START domain
MNDEGATPDRVIIVRRLFAAPRTLVFQTWTDPQHLARWWGPAGFESTVLEMDVRPGGVFRLEMRGPNGNVYPCQGTYREIVEPERIVFAGPEDCGHACGAGLPPRAVVTVTFDDVDGKTLLTIHTRFASESDRDAAAQAGYQPGWESCLERLSDELVGFPTSSNKE